MKNLDYLMDHILYQIFNPKTAGGGVNLTPLTPLPRPLLLCSFSKNLSSKEKVKSCFFVTFNIITSHIFPEDFIKIPQVVQKI